MLVIGIIGGVASGKSLVAEIFQQLGCQVIHADRIGHEALRSPEVISAVRNRWPMVIDSDGNINRSSLGDIVFRSDDSEKNLAILESLTHPIIQQEVDRKIKELEKSGATAVILDAPVLLESGWQDKCDKLVFVDTPLKLRVERSMARGWLTDELEIRESKQMDIDMKKSFATDFLSNDSDQTLLKLQIRQLLDRWGVAVP